MEVYISTGCVRTNDLRKCISQIDEMGYRNIELTGGVSRKSFLDTDLSAPTYSNLKFQCHNYFPPPEKSFVMNLSAEGVVLDMTMALAKASLDISKKMGSSVYGLHAGFRMNPKPSELGHEISLTQLMMKDQAENNLAMNFDILKQYAGSIECYLENNVCTKRNLETYQGDNPFLLCSFSDYLSLQGKCDFKLLLDLGHLKVSCKTLELNFEEELEKLLPHSTYIHISDNNGLADQNLPLLEDSDLFSILMNMKSLFKPKITTVEVYTGYEDVKNTVRSISRLVSGH